MSLPPSCAALELRLLPSAGITQLLRYYEPLRHPAGPSWSSRIPGWRVRATDGASRVAAVSLFTHAAASTPAEPVGARVARFPTAVSLPRINGGSASALPVSRPAQRSLRVAACVLADSPTGDPSSSECFSAFRYLPAPLRLLPAGATVAGRDSHPLGHSAFPRRTLIIRLSGAYISVVLFIQEWPPNRGSSFRSSTPQVQVPASERRAPRRAGGGELPSGS